MAAAVLVVSLLIVAGGASAGMEEPLRVLGELVSGPVRERSLALHLDVALPADVQWAVASVVAVHGPPHSTFSLVHSSGWQGTEGATRAALGDASFYPLHVLLWLEPRPELLQTLCRRWQPRSLLLFTLGPSPGTTALRHEALVGVESLALIGPLSPGGDALGVYTVFPFSRGGVQLLGGWRPEVFSGWASLFPDRFATFEGHTFHLATFFRDPPYLYTTAAAPEVGRGSATRILDALAAKLNFSYTLTPQPPDLNWGMIVNGSWVGVLGMIARGEKNFTVNFYFGNEERRNDFDGSEYVGEGLNCVFLPSPRPMPEWLSLVRPFSPAAWLSLALADALAMAFMAALVSAGTMAAALCVTQLPCDARE